MHAVLTSSWNETITGSLHAETLAEQLSDNRETCLERLNSNVKTARTTDGPLHIMGLDKLFRRHPNGFNKVKRLVSSLITAENQSELNGQVILCHCNALVYGFLSGAKNFDFVLPEYEDQSLSSFRAILPEWLSTIEQLERFEREGIAMNNVVLQQNYLRIRPIMTRASARDEHRSLCVLLTSGPSTLADITSDLGLSYNLSERVVAPFVSTAIVEKSVSTGHYLISESSIALALFLVRETLGVDPLDSLRAWPV